MINLGDLFNSIGVVGGNTASNNQYEFYKGVVWSDGDTTYNQYEFFKKVGGRYQFFKPYSNEREFYRNIDDARIYDYKTFYQYAGEYLGGAVSSDWILATGVWNDAGFWRDEEVWID